MASEDVDKLITFGQMALEQGWCDKAREYFQQALELAPSNREAMKGLARANEILSRKAAAAVEPARADKARSRASRAKSRTGAAGIF
jgi:cytochrome c-type biogenesis protein CcmH/NrfG